MTEEAFWELLKNRSPDNYKKVYDLIENFREMDGIRIDPGESSMVVRLNIPDSGEQVSIFFVTKNAELRVWPRTIVRQLSEAGFDRDLGEFYARQMRNLMKIGENRIEYGRSIREVNIGEFISAVEAFIRSVQRAKPINS